MADALGLVPTKGEGAVVVQFDILSMLPGKDLMQSFFGHFMPRLSTLKKPKFSEDELLDLVHAQLK